MFLSLYNARPSFPLFSLNNRTSLHASCIQGNFIPFQLVYKTYEIKRKKQSKQIKGSIISFQNNGNNTIRTISYPKEFNQYKKVLLSYEHFKSFNKNFQNYIKKYFYALKYPKTPIEDLSIKKLLIMMEILLLH